MINDEDFIIDLHKVSVEASGKSVLKEISLTIKQGEGWAIAGPSGSGKTILGKLLAGLVPKYSGSLIVHPYIGMNRVFVNQAHDFRHLTGGSRAYYQQRFDNNYNSSSPSMEFLLKKAAATFNATNEQLNNIIESLKLTDLLRSQIIELSNGEGKRLQLAIALLKMPKLIVFDNPFLGLDTNGRILLHDIINKLFLKNIFIVIISPLHEMPQCITHIASLEHGRLNFAGEIKNFKSIPQKALKVNLNIDHFKSLYNAEVKDFKVAVEMVNVSVSYSGKVILDKINWKINKGERWALTGPNGAGKSTLLSLIMADNPHGYFNELYLFDNKRGSGESIWEIKKMIGYVSPELQLFFQRNTTHVGSVSNENGTFGVDDFSQPWMSAYDAIASGFHDQIGSTTAITSRQAKIAELWMELLEISAFKKENYNKLSLGTQRLLLLARAMVKNAPLLILDEPCQGLDRAQTENFKKIVDIICENFNKTLIYVSHYPEDIPSCVDKIMVLEKGRMKLLN